MYKANIIKWTVSGEPIICTEGQQTATEATRLVVDRDKPGNFLIWPLVIMDYGLGDSFYGPGMT